MAFNNKVLDEFIFSFIPNSYNFKISFRYSKPNANAIDPYRLYFPCFAFIFFFRFFLGGWDRLGIISSYIIFRFSFISSGWSNCCMFMSDMRSLCPFADCRNNLYQSKLIFPRDTLYINYSFKTKPRYNILICVT